jgi:antitoxin CptB
VNDKRLERIRWRCRRGMLELDLTLQRFLAGYLTQLDHADLEVLEALLTLPDNDLLELVLGQRTPSAESAKLVQLMRDSKPITRSSMEAHYGK